MPRFEPTTSREETGMRCLKQDIIAFVIAILMLLVIILIALGSTIFPGAPELPSFSEPIKGFEPRGTELSNRINALNILIKDSSLTTINPNQKVQKNPPVRRKRRSRQANDCQSRYSYDVKLAFKSKSSGNLFTADNLKAMCSLEKTIMKSAPSMYDYYYFGGCPNCCNSISLGGFIAELYNKTCETISNTDVKLAMNVLSNCSSYFSSGALTQQCSCDNLLTGQQVADNCGNSKVPCICAYKKSVYFIFNTLTDNEFLKTPQQRNLKYSNILSPISWSSDDLFKYIYETHLDTLPESGDVKVAGFDFANFRFDLFNTLLIENAKYPAIAMVFVLIIMCFFLESFLLSFSAMLTVIFALVLSYFLYMVVFGIKFFPFLNVITLVFLVGIGADDAFVYYDIFRQTKSANPNDSIVSLTFKTLRYAALSMFVTSFTTSAAFFANVTSHITSIKAFGIYAGLSILTNYLLMITWFPVLVILHERWVRKRKVDQILQRGNQQQDSNNVVSEVGQEEVAAEEIVNRDGSKPENVQEPRRSLGCLICWAIDFPCHLIPKWDTFFFNKSAKMFGTWLPNAILKKHLYFLWIVLFVGLTIGFACISFVSPGLQLPTSKDFQMFSSSSTLEQYNLHVKGNFRYSNADKSGVSIDLVWGIKAVDNGNYLDPDNKGPISFDDTFDSELTKDAQKWLLTFCQSLKDQSFFDPKESWAHGSLCFMESLKSKCADQRQDPCCKNETFPYSKQVVDACLESSWAWPTFYYDLTSGKAKAMRLKFYTNVSWTAEFGRMDRLWKQVLSWSNSQLEKAPSTFKTGLAICRHMDFYSLQNSLQEGIISSMGVSVAIAFGVMLLTTSNIFISLYAIITIVGIIALTVGSLVLLGWQLSVLESIVFSVSVGLSIDFTMHYGVAYRMSPQKHDRKERVCYSLIHIGSAITMAAFTTFVTGLLMLPAIVLVYIQLGQFLILVMVFSWLFATFAFLSFSAVIGPVGNFGQLSIKRICRACGFCKVTPKEEAMSLSKTEVRDESRGDHTSHYTNPGVESQTSPKAAQA